MLALKYLMNRFSYSMVFCNYVNCVGVQDDQLEFPLRFGVEKFNTQMVPIHPCDRGRRPLAVITSEGRWEGENDGGEGSSGVRLADMII